MHRKHKYSSSMAKFINSVLIQILLFWRLHFEKQIFQNFKKDSLLTNVCSSILFYFKYFNFFVIIQILVWNLPWDYGNDDPGFKCYLGYQCGSDGHDRLLNYVWFYCIFVPWPVPGTNVSSTGGREAIPRGGMRFYHGSPRACSTIDFYTYTTAPPSTDVGTSLPNIYLFWKTKLGNFQI
jgi:hypothetical protein